MPLLLALLSTLGLISTTLIQKYAPQEPVTKNISFKFNERFPTFSSDTIQLLSFGYPRIFSNLLWIRFLQQATEQRVPANELSWIYFDLDAITSIDPGFTPAFEYGGIFLSVVTTDKKGAELFLEKGAKLHPNNWRILAYLAYHYEFELNEPDKAGKIYAQASQIPNAPPLMGMLAARYLSKKDSIEAAILFLTNLQKQTEDEFTKKRLQERIEMWKKKKEGSRAIRH